MSKLIIAIILIITMTRMTVQLVNDIYFLIYQWLDPPSQVMMSLSCKRFLKLGIPPVTRGISLCHYALLYGHLDIIRWTRDRGFPWDPYHCIHLAVEKGDLSFLHWARKRGCQFDTSMCDLATKYNQTKVLKWLRLQHSQWVWSLMNNRCHDIE